MEIKEGNKIIYEDEQEYSEEQKDGEAQTCQSLPIPDLSSIQVANSQKDEHGSSITFPTSGEQSSNSDSNKGKGSNDSNQAVVECDAQEAQDAPEAQDRQDKADIDKPEEPLTVQINTCVPRKGPNTKDAFEYEERKGSTGPTTDQPHLQTVENGKKFTQLEIL